jgi:hypothetical protein
MTTDRSLSGPTDEERSTGEWVPIPLPELPWAIEAQGEVVAGRLRVVGMAMRPRKDSTEFVDDDCVISADALRALPLRRITEHLAGMVTAEIGIPVDQPGPHGRWDDEHFRKVASAYETAVEAGLAPLPVIQGYWSVSRTAASRWVRIARDRGYLGSAEELRVASATAKSTPKKRSGAPSETKTPKAASRTPAARRSKDKSRGGDQ